MSEAEKKFHETWLGMAQPIDGLVVSVPVLLEAQCTQRQSAAQHREFVERLHIDDRERLHTGPLALFLQQSLGYQEEDLVQGEELPQELELYIPEGQQVLRPSLGIQWSYPPEQERGDASDRFALLCWELPLGLALDAPEEVTGPWRYPPSAKFDRLLRACKVPVGLLSNGHSLRLVYAPHGESSGSITFKLADMAQPDGRDLLSAFVMLLESFRVLEADPEQALHAILHDSRGRQADVTASLAEQVFEALQLLLDGLQEAAERDGSQVLAEAARRPDDHLYGGLLTLMMRLVFLLYAEDQGLMPMESPFYSQHMSLTGLFEQLQEDAGAFPDTMHRRFGAWPRMLSLFRAIYQGMTHDDFVTPARRGRLFSPGRYPFLEGWSGPSPPMKLAEDRAAVRTPSVDDETVYRALRRLLVLDGQRLSYRALDVEQIGSVYERLMGYQVQRLTQDAACLGSYRRWVQPDELLAVAASGRQKWLQGETDLSASRAKALADQLKKAKQEQEVLQAMEDFLVKGTAIARAGRLVIQPGAERQRTSSHYTPRSLSSRVVTRTLEPLLAALGQAPSADQLLALKVCDPAMGSGAFLVEACRVLADQVVAAWTRAKELNDVVPSHLDPVVHARRLVAQNCLYGVDKNAFAVDLARLSLWLVTLARDEPFTFVDHALRHGDTLVGLDTEQLRAFDWRGGKQTDLLAQEIDASVRDALVMRQELLTLTRGATPDRVREQEWLLRNAEEAIEKARLIADMVVGAFFAATKSKARLNELSRRRTLVEAWLRSGSQETPQELLDLQAELHQHTPAFHWILEFPEIFYDTRPDPLDHNKINHAAWMDAFVGNPPFAGKNNISASNAPGYLDWLKEAYKGSHGNADLSAYFFRRAHSLLGRHGTMGLIATNTIAQGDTRDTGLKALVKDGCVIYDATESMPWPGEAAVTVSVVHLGQGVTTPKVCNLNGIEVKDINSRLRPKPERADPVQLKANAGLSFMGAIVLGMGFTLTPEERKSLLLHDPRNTDCVFPYLGGREVNSSPTQDFERYVINFGDMALTEAETWPDLIKIIRERVKPDRDKLKDNADGRRRKKYWWKFGRSVPALDAAIAPLTRCLVTARVTKHLCFSFQPTDRVLNEKLYVFPFDTHAHFALLQSRIHEPWAWLFSSTMKTDLNYSASSCFETFPFPPANTLEARGDLEKIGEELYERRARYMVDTQQGLTQTYNQLKDPYCEESEVVALRELHEAMDAAVLAAYGWSDISVPPYVLEVDGEGEPQAEAVEARQDFEDEVIDRLMALNEERAKAERRASAAAKKKTGKKSSGGQTSLL